eukprot:3430692-Pleurochrysis_carterae.AAC.1
MAVTSRGSSDGRCRRRRAARRSLASATPSIAAPLETGTMPFVAYARVTSATRLGAPFGASR